MEIPTVGRSIAEKVHEYLQSGGIEELEILEVRYDPID